MISTLRAQHGLQRSQLLQEQSLGTWDKTLGLQNALVYRSGGIKQLSHSIHVWYTYLHLPIYIFHKNQPNVGEYTIHGWYGENVIW